VIRVLVRMGALGILLGLLLAILESLILLFFWFDHRPYTRIDFFGFLPISFVLNVPVWFFCYMLICGGGVLIFRTKEPMVLKKALLSAYVSLGIGFLLLANFSWLPWEVTPVRLSALRGPLFLISCIGLTLVSVFTYRILQRLSMRLLLWIVVSSPVVIAILLLFAITSLPPVFPRNADFQHVPTKILTPEDKDLPNVVLVVILNLRADHLLSYGYPLPTTPFFSQLSKRGQQFENFYASCALPKCSLATLLTGTHSGKHGLLVKRWGRKDGRYVTLSRNLPTLLDVFASRGYNVASFVSHDYLEADYGLFRGSQFHFEAWFDHYGRGGQMLYTKKKLFVSRLLEKISPELFRLTEHLNYAWIKVFLKFFRLYRLDSYNYWSWINRVASAYLQHLKSDEAWSQNRAKFFLLIQYSELHDLFDPPMKYVRKLYPGGVYQYLDKRMAERIYKRLREQGGKHKAMEVIKRRITMQYDGEVRYTDDGLKDLFSRLDALGVMDNTIWIVTSLQGAELLEHGSVRGIELYEGQVRVPFLMGWRGEIASGKHVKGISGLVDVMPTLLELAGISKANSEKSRHVQGRSFLGELMNDAPIKQRETIYGENPSRGSSFLRWRNWKLLMTNENSGSPTIRLFDLKKDPREKKDVFNLSRDEELLRMLKRYKTPPGSRIWGKRVQIHAPLAD